MISPDEKVGKTPGSAFQESVVWGRDARRQSGNCSRCSLCRGAVPHTLVTVPPRCRLRERVPFMVTRDGLSTKSLIFRTKAQAMPLRTPKAGLGERGVVR